MVSVSLIVPIYNSQLILEKCLNSVLDQSYKDFECILVNDGSTDMSMDICQKFVTLDSRFKLFTQKNQGVSSARNLGLNKSKGKYIVFLDSDDTISKDYLRNLVSNNWNKDMVISGVYTVLENGNINPRLKYESFIVENIGINQINTMILNRSIDYVYAKLFTKSIIRDNNIHFNEDIDIAEDTLFVCEYLTCCNSVVFINSIDYYYHDYTSMSLSKYNSSIIKRLEIANKKIEQVLDSHFRGIKDSIEWKKRCWSVYYYYFFFILNLPNKSLFYKNTQLKQVIKNRRFKYLCKEKDVLMEADSKKAQILISIKNTYLILVIWKLLAIKNKN